MLSKITTYLRLGISNSIIVVCYRLALKLGYFAKHQPIDQSLSKNDLEYFSPYEVQVNGIAVPKLQGFGWIDIDTSSIPNWLKAINTNAEVTENTMHWSEFNEFELDIGDIKTVWELSRFDWILHFAIEAKRTNGVQAISRLNKWLNDWCQHNPANQGVNWKCGQEASIRVMHLLAANMLLKQERSMPKALTKLIFLHLERIAPTRFYAMAQDNNHGTSEACALFVGATALLAQQEPSLNVDSLSRWQKQGRYWLGNRAEKLIDKDGLFSQYSVNYHRVMLDTFCFAEQVRVQFEQPEFSQQFYVKAQLASQWLYQMTQANTGDASNLGANDGARLFPITQCDYRDYRPSVQWAFGLFFHKFPYPTQAKYQQLTALLSPQNEALSIFDSTDTLLTTRLSSQVQKLCNSKAAVYIKTPQAVFRPSSCDALHLDLWVGDINLLRDAGSYSYNCEPELAHYFKSTRAHNTVEFDEEEQMPKISRFLYGQWTTTDIVEVQENLLSATCKNYRGAIHHRHVLLTENQLTITDTLTNFEKEAVIRFRLAPATWTVENTTVRSALAQLNFEGLPSGSQIKLVDGLESRYYLQKSIIPVLEITITQAATITTIINWSS